MAIAKQSHSGDPCLSRAESRGGNLKGAKSDLSDVARKGVNRTELCRARAGVVEGSEITTDELQENKGFRN